MGTIESTRTNHSVGVVVRRLVSLELVHARVAFLAHFACQSAISHTFDTEYSHMIKASYRRTTFARLLHSPSTPVATCCRAVVPSVLGSLMLYVDLTGAMM